MYIKLTTELVDLAIADPSSRAYMVLKMLDWCCYQGNHFISGDLEELVKINKNFKNDLRCLANLYTTYSLNEEILQSFKWHLEFITDENPIPLTRKDVECYTIYVNIKDDFEVYRECHLLAENLNDVKIFKQILAYYKRKHSYSSVNTKIYPILGGGSTTKDVYAHEISLGKSLVLSIVDSDKHFPGAPLGDTAKGVQRIDAEKNAFNAFYYIMEGVLEVENLIPLHVYKNYVVGKSDLKRAMDAILKIFEHNPALLNYYDYKEGITPRLLEDINPNNNTYVIASIAQNSIDELISIKREEWKQFRECLNNFEFLSDQDKDKIFNKRKKGDCYIPGLGKNILENILNSHLFDGANIDNEDLSDIQEQEYENIGELIYNWACSSKPIRI